MKHFRALAHPSQGEPMTEPALRAYLLGKLTESEVELVEARLVEDPDLFAQMETAEDDLFDAFARGSLDADEQARFLERFGADRRRQQFAKALVSRTSSRKVVPFVRRPWVGLAVAATLVIAVGAFVMPRQSVEETAVPTPSAAPVAVPVAPITASVSLALGSSRAAGGPAKVVIAPDATRVEIRVRLNPADQFAAYAAQIRSQADNIVWADAVQAEIAGGDLVARAIVPADRLPAGTYEIAIRGGASAGALDDLGFVTIEVSRTQ
jgi:hypothetical protein